VQKLVERTTTLYTKLLILVRMTITICKMFIWCMCFQLQFHWCVLCILT